MKDMVGKVALITGASSGIGKATAMRFAERGAKVAICNKTEATGLTAAQEIREATGADVKWFACDVAHHDQVKGLIENVVKHFGRLDYAYNNAGDGSTQAKTADCTEEIFDKAIAVNLKGNWLLMKYQILQMLKQGGGAIVNCASAAGILAVPYIPAYTAAKHGVVGLTKNAAVEYAQDNIRVNVVCPGAVQTPMLDNFTGGDPAIVQMLETRQAMGRIGKPRELANAVTWLCSDEASFVNGAVVPVDGGWTAH